MTTTEDEGPRLGMATTRQLLQEISARMEVNRTIQEDDYGLGRLVDQALVMLPEGLLEYRTVDGG